MATISELGLLIIPALISGIPAEYFCREESVKRDYERIARLGNGEGGEREAVINLAGGCEANKKFMGASHFRQNSQLAS